jgi:hypothetical protein
VKATTERIVLKKIPSLSEIRKADCANGGAATLQIGDVKFGLGPKNEVAGAPIVTEMHAAGRSRHLEHISEKDV